MCAAVLTLVGSATAAPDQSAWSFKSKATLKAGYDSNVYLQDTAPSASVPRALPADQASLVSQLALATTTSWQGRNDLKLTFDYNPEITRFHSATAESNVTHVTSLKLSGGSSATVWTLKNVAKWIDGTDEGPTYGGSGGAPALGGLPVRDRRDAFVQLGSFQLTHTQGRWMLRPAVSTYLHDFGIKQRTAPGYVNFIDRSEFLAGIDLGYELRPHTRLVAGYRLGNQQQYKLLGADSPYDSTIRRFIVGLEGAPADWLKLDLQVARENRRYAAGTPAGFDRGNQPYWIYLSATAKLGPQNEITAFYTHRDLPSSASKSMYTDTVGKIFWKRQLTSSAALTTGYTLIRGDWRLPAVRNDRIHCLSLGWQYSFNKCYSIDLGWSYDKAVSCVTATPGREYRRHLANAGLQFSF